MRGQPRRSPVLPVGTQVVLRHALVGMDDVIAQNGATGRVRGLEPDGRYRVPLTDGRLVLCRRDEVSLRRAYQHDLAIGPNPTTADGHDLVRQHTIYAAVVGSRAFGLDTDASDVDTRGVVRK